MSIRFGGYAEPCTTGDREHGLAKNAQPPDAELARPYLVHTTSSLRDAAVTVISKVGNPDDASALLGIAKEAYGDVQKEAALAALNLSSSPLALAQPNGDHPRTIEAKLDSALLDMPGQPRDFTRELEEHDDLPLRNIADYTHSQVNECKRLIASTIVRDQLPS